MRFLFRLDLSLHTGAGNFFGILNYATKQGLFCLQQLTDHVTSVRTELSVKLKQ